MSEIKNNTINLEGELANIQVKSRKDGKITVLRVEIPSQDLDDVAAGQLFKVQGSSIGIDITPAQMELDTDDKPQEAEGQTEMFKQE